MPSCKPKNKIACASSTEHRGRVLRGSDRSAEHGLAQTAAGRRQYEKEYGRPSQAPPASARPCSTLDLRFVNPQPCFQIEIVPERCPKSTHQDNESGYFYLM